MQWWCVAQTAPWSWTYQAYPGVWLFMIALIGVGILARRRFRDESGSGSLVAGVAGIAGLWAALDWPLGVLGSGYLASVHMVQFLLICMVASPLLLLALPAGFYAALEQRLGGILTTLTHPLVAMGQFAALVGLTHWPPVVDGLMVTQWGNFLLDSLWLMTGVWFWWPVAAAAPRRRWFGYPAKIGYLIIASIVNTGVFAYLVFSGLPLYSVFELAPPIDVLPTRTDQRLAGLMMKTGGALVLWTWISVLFFRWHAQETEEDSHTSTIRPTSMPPEAV